MEIPDGAYTALVTPFTSDGKVDMDDLKNLIETQNKSNITGLVLFGTTGESPTIGNDIKDSLIKKLHELISKDKFTIVGVGGNDTAAVTEFAYFAHRFADAIMVTVPAYNKPPQEGIEEHFVTVASHKDVKNTPILIYNIPSRTGTNMEPETMLRIAKRCPNVVGVKEASGDMEQVKKIIKLFKDNNMSYFKVFSGDDTNVVEICRLGGKGVVSVASNIAPNLVSELTLKCLREDYHEAQKLSNNSLSFFESLFLTSNPIPSKELLYHLKQIKTNTVRLPLVPMSNEKQKETLHLAYDQLLKLYPELMS